MELVDLTRDLIQDAKHQLTYYRASVYKIESAGHITKRIEQMKVVARLFGDDWMLEPFKDYAATVSAGNSMFTPGECSFSHRVTTLLVSLEAQLVDITRNLHKLGSTGPGVAEFTKNVQEHRGELLAMCQQGSRQWAFFHTLCGSR
jgi:hypothetical protein